jgi:hypothetical protein
MRCDGAFSVGATAADAPPAIAKDAPAAPHIGKAVLGRFRFESCFVRAIVEPPVFDALSPHADRDAHAAANAWRGKTLPGVAASHPRRGETGTPSQEPKLLPDVALGRSDLDQINPRPPVSTVLPYVALGSL